MGEVASAQPAAIHSESNGLNPENANEFLETAHEPEQAYIDQATPIQAEQTALAKAGHEEQLDNPPKKEYTFTHSDGRTISGDAETMAEECPAMRGLSPRQIEIVARMRERGQQKLAERERSEDKARQGTDKPESDEFLRNERRVSGVKEYEASHNNKTAADKTPTELTITKAAIVSENVPPNEADITVNKSRTDLENIALLANEAQMNQDVIELSPPEIIKAAAPTRAEKNAKLKADVMKTSGQRLDYDVPITSEVSMSAIISEEQVEPPKPHNLEGAFVKELTAPPDLAVAEAETDQGADVAMAAEAIDTGAVNDINLAKTGLEAAVDDELYELPMVTEFSSQDIDEIYERIATMTTDTYAEITDESMDLCQSQTQPIEMATRLEQGEEEQNERQLSVTVRMPVAIQERITAYRDTVEPEDHLVIERITISVENKVAEFKELAVADEPDIEKLVEAEAAIVESYDRLLQEIGVEDQAEREELADQFIVSIHAEIERDPPKPSAEVQAEAFVEEDEGTHEHKRHWSTMFLDQNLSMIGHRLGHALGRFTVGKARIEPLT